MVFLSINCYISSSHHTGFLIKIILISINCRPAYSHLAGILCPTGKHITCTCKISGIFFTVCKECLAGSHSTVTVEIISLSLQCQPFRLHESGRWIKISFLILWISDPACHHDTSLFTEISLSSFTVSNPALYLNTGLCVKVIFLSFKFQPTLLFRAIFIYVVWISVNSYKTCFRCSLYICRSKIHGNSHSKKQQKQKCPPDFKLPVYVLHTYLPFLFSLSERVWKVWIVGIALISHILLRYALRFNKVFYNVITFLWLYYITL